MRCLLRQILIRCVSSSDGVLAKDINNVQECCVLPEAVAGGVILLSSRYYVNLRLSFSFLLVFPLTPVGIYFNSLNSCLLFGA